MPNYCIPILYERGETILKVIEENSSLYQYFEVWLGAVTNLDDAFLGHLLSLHGESLVILFRKKGLEISLDQRQRRFFIREMNNSPAFLDLDIVLQRDDIEYLRGEKLNVKTILSYHNFEKTPEDKDLYKLLDSMTQANATVCKFATRCNTPEDAVRLLKLGLEIKKSGRDYIVLGIGPHGAVTRTFGTLWGNKMIFAPREAAHGSAPGQLTRFEIESILDTINGAAARE